MWGSSLSHAAVDRYAPVIGRDAWIHERVTCHIPDKEFDLSYIGWFLNTKLTNVVHIASQKYASNRFVTRCWFEFPRQVCENAKIVSSHGIECDPLSTA